MKCNVQGNGSNNYTERNKSIQGFLISAQSTATMTVAAMESVMVQGVLTTPNGTFNVLSGNLFALARATNPAQLEGTDLDAGAGFRYGWQIDLGQVVNLGPSDTFNVTLTVGGSVAGQVTQCATLYGVGVGEYIPQIIVYSVDKNRTNQDQNLGENVNFITIVHTGTAYVVTNISVQSDKWEFQGDTGEFDALISQQWQVANRDQTFTLYAGQELDNVNLQMTVNGAASGNAYIVSHAGLVNPYTTRRATSIIKKIAARAAAKFNVHE